MRHVTFTKQMFLVTITVMAFVLSACHKNGVPVLANQNKDLLAIADLYGSLKINQAITIYDSSLDRTDSINIRFPNKLFKWEVIPNNGCDSVIGNHAGTGFIFHCAGTYQVTAKIYDSLTQNLIGSTDTISVHVNADTLYPTQPIASDDMLNIQASVTTNYSDSPNATSPAIVLDGLTRHLYYRNLSYSILDANTNTSPNNYSLTFTGIRLSYYPFDIGAYGTSKIEIVIRLNGLTYNVPANLSITWLGKTYTGTVTLLSPTKYTLTWDNSGAVTMK